MVELPRSIDTGPGKPVMKEIESVEYYQNPELL